MAKQAKIARAIKDEVVAFKRERIVDAAVDLFYAHGYDNTTLDAVARRLGVTKPFIYSYFESKADLLSEICSRAIRSSLDAVDAVLAENQSPVCQLDAFSRKFTCAVLGSQKHMAVFAREEKNLTRTEFERIANMRRKFDRKLTGLLERGAAKGEFLVTDPRLVALAIGGMVSWSYAWYRSNGRLTPDEVAEQMASLILRMVRVPPP